MIIGQALRDQQREIVTFRNRMMMAGLFIILAFALGLLMDVSDSMLLGQHAFAYVVAIYGAQVLRVRILTFRLPEQTLHMLGIVLASSLVTLLLNLLLGADFPGVAYFISPVLTALCWAPVSWLLYSPAVRRRRHEATP